MVQRPRREYHLECSRIILHHSGQDPSCWTVPNIISKQFDAFLNIIPVILGVCVQLGEFMEEGIVRFWKQRLEVGIKLFLSYYAVVTVRPS